MEPGEQKCQAKPMALFGKTVCLCPLFPVLTLVSMGLAMFCTRTGSERTELDRLFTIACCGVMAFSMIHALPYQVNRGPARAFIVRRCLDVGLIIFFGLGVRSGRTGGIALAIVIGAALLFLGQYWQVQATQRITPLNYL